jgi:hypothetical protein
VWLVPIKVVLLEAPAASDVGGPPVITIPGNGSVIVTIRVTLPLSKV